ncbi:hypothetical protein [Cellulomonas gilvus]|uniref:PPE protein n=1 Tax=Cellulomonas gilvus (strain ATCC 13127 / NRRL B-14078) TaxID=593907 RepID=F7ZZ08_CELGA|nr:hypothetical protein [Cellulomonas gilvus]AEI11276.1 hypothetical protein Celgi_0757 [Cellulomonas gilvus ATCC 13127]
MENKAALELAKTLSADLPGVESDAGVLEELCTPLTEISATLRRMSSDLGMEGLAATAAQESIAQVARAMLHEVDALNAMAGIAVRAADVVRTARTQYWDLPSGTLSSAERQKYIDNGASAGLPYIEQARALERERVAQEAVTAMDTQLMALADELTAARDDQDRDDVPGPGGSDPGGGRPPRNAPTFGSGPGGPGGTAVLYQPPVGGPVDEPTPTPQPPTPPPPPLPPEWPPPEPPEPPEPPVPPQPPWPEDPTDPTPPEDTTGDDRIDFGTPRPGDPGPIGGPVGGPQTGQPPTGTTPGLGAPTPPGGVFGGALAGGVAVGGAALGAVGNARLGMAGLGAVSGQLGGTPMVAGALGGPGAAGAAGGAGARGAAGGAMAPGGGAAGGASKKKRRTGALGYLAPELEEEATAADRAAGLRRGSREDGPAVTAVSTEDDETW